RALPGFADELAAAARSFDDVTYGGVPGTRAAYDAMRDLDERLRVARPVLLAGQAAAGAPGGTNPLDTGHSGTAGGSGSGGTGSGGSGSGGSGSGGSGSGGAA
ncbi:DUF4129 domain-containing protein, partial [Nonomuraea lactucae]|uniref:DUF4129 domain-containing protein n=1 Tax=Nonomuraea lactucae TaxID=2249762 RepID=UPI0019663899